MPATGNLVPTADGTIDAGVTGYGGATSPWWDDIDSGIATPDDTQGYQTANDFDGISGFFDITDMPSDFGTMDTLYTSVRTALSESPTNDTYAIRTRIFQSNETTELSDTPSYVSVANVDPSFVEKTILLTNVTSGSKSIWDAARLAIDHLHTQSKGGDNVKMIQTEAQADGTYIVSSARRIFIISRNRRELQGIRSWRARSTLREGWARDRDRRLWVAARAAWPT